MQVDLGVRAAKDQAHGPIAKPHAPGMTTRASAGHVAQLKCAIGRGRFGPDNTVMPARQVFAWEETAGIQRVVTKRCWLEFLQFTKDHVGNHLERGVAKRARVERFKARTVLRFDLLDLCPPRSCFVLPGLKRGGGGFSLWAPAGNGGGKGRCQRCQGYESTTESHN